MVVVFTPFTLLLWFARQSSRGISGCFLKGSRRPIPLPTSACNLKRLEKHWTQPTQDASVLIFHFLSDDVIAPQSQSLGL